MLSVNQNEAQRAAERVKVVFDAKRARGEVCSGQTPPGIGITPDKHLMAVEPEASMMRDVFREFLAVRSSYQAQRYMANTYGVLRDTTTFRKLLRNKKYRGLVVDEATFDAAQELLAARSQRNAAAGRIYLFAGLLICKSCGYRMIAYMANNDCIYYRCGRRFNVGDCDFNKHVREDAIERYLLDHFAAGVEEYNAELRARQHVKVDTAAIKRKLDKLTDIYMADLISREKYEREYRDLQAALVVQQTEDHLIDPVQARTALDIYSQLDRRGQKEFWSRTIKQITVAPDGTFSFTLRSL